MRQTKDAGLNKTGIAMAQKMGDQMARSAEEGKPSSAGDEHAISSLRQEYMHDAPPVGSTPSPAKAKGAVKEGMKGRHPAVFMDKLGERLAFERTGTRLYEAMIPKFDALGAWDGGPTRDELIEFHQQEKEHFAMVHEVLENLGADPSAVTPSADVAGVVSMGVLQVITDPRTTLAEAMQALLVAELADNDGWQMLIRLAVGLDEKELAERFRLALVEEDKHLASVRRWISVDAEREILGATKKKPRVH